MLRHTMFVAVSLKLNHCKIEKEETKKYPTMKKVQLTQFNAGYAKPTIVELTVAAEVGFSGSSESTLEDLTYDDPDGGF